MDISAKSIHHDTENLGTRACNLLLARIEFADYTLDPISPILAND